MAKTIILDTAAITSEFPLAYLNERLITSPKIIDEVRSKKGKKTLDFVFNLDKIEQRIPKEEFVGEIKKEAAKTRDTLSVQDVELLALALEFKGEIATDDYGVQNIAKKLGIEFIPVYERGIKKIIEWQYYCPACFKEHEKSGDCKKCGTKLKRKAKQKY